MHRYQSAAARASERLEAAAVGLGALDFEHGVLTAVNSTPIGSLVSMLALGWQAGRAVTGRLEDAALAWRLRERWVGWRLRRHLRGRRGADPEFGRAGT